MWCSAVQCSAVQAPEVGLLEQQAAEELAALEQQFEAGASHLGGPWSVLVVITGGQYWWSVGGGQLADVTLEQ
jgi:hypothetical protein